MSEQMRESWRWEARRQAFLSLALHMPQATPDEREDAARDVVEAIERSGAMTVTEEFVPLRQKYGDRYEKRGGGQDEIDFITGKRPTNE